MTEEMTTVEAYECLDPTGENGFICPTCGQSYSRAEYLRRHQRKHSEARPFSCADCNKTFARSDVLLRHRRRVHPAQALEDEKNKPPPPVASSSVAKKAAPARRRNRNARRPYPAQNVNDAESDESDAESPSNTVAQTVDFSLPISTSALASAAALAQAISQSTDSLAIPDLSWSPSEGSPSSSSSSASPPNILAQSFTSPSPLSHVSPEASNQVTTLEPHELHEVNREARVTKLATGPIPPPGTISPLEAGAIAWALNNTTTSTIPSPRVPAQLARSRPSSRNGYRTEQHPSGETGEEMFQPKVLDLPFLSPEANVYMPPKGVNMASAGANVYEQYMMSQLATTGVPSPGGRATFSTDMLNREYAMIDSEGRLRHTLSGATRSDPNDKFYIPPGLFAGCYTVPHWLLPPLQRLSVFAGNSFRNIGYHLGVIHEPTFRLADAHAWLAFALCTAAGHKPFKTRTKWVEPEPWDAVQSVVRTEKTGMFVKLFARAGSKLPAAETFSGIQALLIYNAQSFLSENASDRLVGDIFLSTISKLARRSGVFDPDADWAKPNINISPDIGNDWVRWVRSESCRRTIWIVYLLDVQSSIESSAIPLVSPRDVRHLPIPTPDILWSAPNAVTWAMLISHPTFSVFTLDDAMQKLFDFSAEPENINKSPGASPSSAGVGSPALDSAGDATTVTPSVLDIVSLGPFARLVIVITILRGLIEYGEGNIRGGYVVQRWITGGQNGHFAYTGTDPELFHQSVMRAFSRALIRWKNGWEFDTLCPKTPFFVNPESDTRPIALFNQDAMPFYWMCQILLTHMSGGTNTPTSTPGPSGVMGPSPRRWVDEREDGEGQRRLVDIDLAATFATAKSVADPFTMGMDVNEAGFGV